MGKCQRRSRLAWLRAIIRSTCARKLVLLRGYIIWDQTTEARASESILIASVLILDIFPVPCERVCTKPLMSSDMVLRAGVSVAVSF